jgi:hypothetical protein
MKLMGNVDCICYYFTITLLQCEWHITQNTKFCPAKVMKSLNQCVYICQAS